MHTYIRCNGTNTILYDPICESPFSVINIKPKITTWVTLSSAGSCSFVLISGNKWVGRNLLVWHTKLSKHVTVSRTQHLATSIYIDLWCLWWKGGCSKPGRLQNNAYSYGVPGTCNRIWSLVPGMECCETLFILHTRLWQPWLKIDVLVSALEVCLCKSTWSKVTLLQRLRW